jgi:hypothetical protein
MRNFIYLLITLILTGFVIGIAYLQVTYGEGWFIAFIPLCLFIFLWGIKITDEYSDR